MRDKTEKRRGNRYCGRGHAKHKAGSRGGTGKAGLGKKLKGKSISIKRRKNRIISLNIFCRKIKTNQKIQPNVKIVSPTITAQNLKFLKTRGPFKINCSKSVEKIIN